MGAGDERGARVRESPLSGLSQKLTILLDLLVEVVDINSVIGTGLGNCHGVRCRGRVEIKKMVTSALGFSKSVVPTQAYRAA